MFRRKQGHNHRGNNLKPRGQCPGCDREAERRIHHQNKAWAQSCPNCHGHPTVNTTLKELYQYFDDLAVSTHHDQWWLVEIIGNKNNKIYVGEAKSRGPADLDYGVEQAAQDLMNNMRFTPGVDATEFWSKQINRIETNLMLQKDRARKKVEK